MEKNTKKILIKRKIHEVIKIQKNQRIILYCENCQSEQDFSAINATTTNHVLVEKEIKQLSKSNEEKKEESYE